MTFPLGQYFIIFTLFQRRVFLLDKMQIVILQNQMLIVYIIRDFQCFCYSNNLHRYLNDTISFRSTKVHILKGFTITKFVETSKVRGKFFHIFVAFSENLNFTTVHYQVFFNFLPLLQPPPPPPKQVNVTYGRPLSRHVIQS